MTPMTDEFIFDTLRSVVMLVTGVPECILGNPNAPSPIGSYAAIQVGTNRSQRGQANVSRHNYAGNMIETIVKRQMYYDCSVEFYRDGANQYAGLLKECNKFPNVNMILRRAKIGWISTGNVQNLTTLQSSNFEERAHVTVRLALEIVTSDKVNNILSTSARVEDEKGRILTSIDVQLK